MCQGCLLFSKYQDQGTHGTDNESYEKLFNMERLPVRFNMDKDEHNVILPAGTLLHSNLLNDKSFLSNVKAELYVIFDRLADLEHVVIPKRVGHSVIILQLSGLSKI